MSKTFIGEMITGDTFPETSCEFMDEMIAGKSGGGGSSGSKVKLDSAAHFCYGGCRLDLLDGVDTSTCASFNSMFYGTNKVTSLPVETLDTRNGTDFSYMFYRCTQLTKIPTFDASKGVDFSSAFAESPSLVSVPELSTHNVTMFGNTFINCTALTTVEGLDLNSALTVMNMFRFCSSLIELKLYNIRAALQIGSGSSWGHLLTVDSLVHIIKELCPMSSSTILTMGAVNLEKISGLYCKVTDNTTEKIDMELCESTDEGAMTLAQYASLKKWTFQ